MDGTKMVADGVIEREVRIAAQPETVFDFWVDPAQMARWMGRTINAGRAAGRFLPNRLQRIGHRERDVRRDRAGRRGSSLTWGWEAAGRPDAARRQHGRGDVRARRRRHDRPAWPLRSRRRGGRGPRGGWDQFLPGLVEARRARGRSQPTSPDEVLDEEQSLANRASTDSSETPRASPSAAITSSGRPEPSSGWIRVRDPEDRSGGRPPDDRGRPGAAEGRRPSIPPPFGPLAWQSIRCQQPPAASASRTPASTSTPARIPRSRPRRRGPTRDGAPSQTSSTAVSRGRAA